MTGLYVIALVLILEAGAFAWFLWPRRVKRQRRTPNAERLAFRAERRRQEIHQTTNETQARSIS